MGSLMQTKQFLFTILATIYHTFIFYIMDDSDKYTTSVDFDATVDMSTAVVAYYFF